MFGSSGKIVYLRGMKVTNPTIQRLEAMKYRGFIVTKTAGRKIQVWNPDWSIKTTCSNVTAAKRFIDELKSEK